jgi:tellurite resistance protein TerA
LLNAMRLVTGQKVTVSDHYPGLQFEVSLSFQTEGRTRVDACCFGLDRRRRLFDPGYFLHRQGQSFPDGSVRYLGPSPRGDSSLFQVDLASLNADVARLAFAAFVAGPGTFNQLEYGHIRFSQPLAEETRYFFSGDNFAFEKAVVVGQIYLHLDNWRISADGQGYMHGVKALFDLYDGRAFYPRLAGPELGVTLMTAQEAAELHAQLAAIGLDSFSDDSLAFDDFDPAPPRRRTLH